MTARRSAVYVVGTGSFAAEVCEYAAAAGLAVLGLVELLDPSRVGTRIHGHPVVGLDPAEEPQTWRVAIGLGRDRLRHAGVLTEHGWTFASIIHPSAVISASAVLGNGVIVGPQAVLGAQSILRDGVLVARGALIGHHVQLGEWATVNPGANLGGNSRVGAGAVIGMGATIVNEISVGPEAVIAAGSVVVRDAPAGERLQGVPARVFPRTANGSL